MSGSNGLTDCSVNHGTAKSSHLFRYNTASAVSTVAWEDLDKQRLYAFMPFGSFVVRALFYPATLVKTRLQIPGTTYRGMSDAFVKIGRYEGIRGMYAGFGTSLFGLVVGPIYVTCFEASRSSVLRYLLNGSNEKDQSKEVTASGVAGLFASIIAQTFAVPIDVVSARRMVQGMDRNSTSTPSHSSPIANSTRSSSIRNNRHSPFRIARDLYMSEGCVGLYRGYVASICVSVPTSGTMWGTYFALQPHVQKIVNRGLFMFEDAFRNRLGNNEKNRNVENRKYTTLNTNRRLRWESLVPSLFTCVITGGCAGGVAAVATSPMDVIRTRLQVSEAASSSVWKAGKGVFFEAGIKGFWKGCGARMAGMVPSTALLITSYELLKRLCLKDGFDDIIFRDDGLLN